MDEPLTAASWPEAVTLVRQLGAGTKARVPKSAGSPPDDLRLRRSNVPWSVHRGAAAVYREDVPGEHLQVREYGDHWLVELDRHNPHYRPARHVAVDTRSYTVNALSNPVWTAIGIALFTPVRSLQFTEEVATLAVDAPKSLVESGLETARDGLSLLTLRRGSESAS
ncbi:hypothetical protein [Halorarius halobius]|uniref:hypothetical protein n=1 Tax=Halorarius halobius TaxID=2962671 RepID=UPI0020CDA988|nr:hypothetical protein [Halorarius halobius]